VPRIEVRYLGVSAGPTAGFGMVMYSYTLPADPAQPGSRSAWVEFLVVDLWVS